MAKHARGKSRGSLSIFSLDAIRSRSRAGSRQAYRLPTDDERSKNSGDRPGQMPSAAATADPLLRPLPPTPAPSIRQRSNLSHVSLAAEPEDIVQSSQQANSDARKQNFMKVTERDVPKPRKHRPLSWLPPSGTTSGKASHMPKNSTASTVERSTISAPVLTCTTNAKVALTEGVHCGKITPSGLAASSWYPESGWIADDDVVDFAKDQPYRVQEPQSPGGHESQPYQRSKGLSETFKRPSKRSASMNALSKVKEALTARLRQASDPQTYRSVFSRDKFVRLGDDCRPPTPGNGQPGRIQTEGQNLGREKIRALTGHGHVRKKPLQYSVQDSHDAPREGKRPFLIDADETSNPGCYRTDQREHEVNFHFEDLETSFAKAVEKLDFRIRRDKASLTSLSSFFHSGKNISATNNTKAPQPLQCLPLGSYSHPLSNTDHPPHTSSPNPIFDQLASGQPSMGQCASCAFKCSSGRAKAPPEVYPSSYQTDPTSKEGIDKADRAALAQRVFSRGHSNPLASHPDLTKFADQPTPTTTNRKMPPRGGTSGMQITHEEHNLHDLEGAPIYSPSLENLSQYSRNTPSSAPGSTNLSSHKLHAANSRMPLIETPTRPSRRGTNGRDTATNQHRNPPRRSPNAAFRSLHKHDENRSPRSNVTQSRDLIYESSGHSERVFRAKDRRMAAGTDGLVDDCQSSLGVPAGASGNVIKNDYEKGVGCCEH